MPNAELGLGQFLADIAGMIDAIDPAMVDHGQIHIACTPATYVANYFFYADVVRFHLADNADACQLMPTEPLGKFDVAQGRDGRGSVLVEHKIGTGHIRSGLSLCLGGCKSSGQPEPKIFRLAGHGTRPCLRLRFQD